MVEMNSIPWSPVLRYATPLPMNRTPVSTVALQHKSVSSVLRYATPLPINRTLFRPREVCFLRFAVRQTPPEEQDPVSTVASRTQGRFLRYGTPGLVSIGCSVQADRLPMNTMMHFLRSDPAGWLPMNTTTTLFLRSDPAMYMSHGRTYA